MINFIKIVEDYRAVYHIFEKYEGKKWNAEANIIELYKQIGEMVSTKQEKNIEQYGDEVLDTLCQIIRLMDCYNYDVYTAYEMSKEMDYNDSYDEFSEMIKNLGILSKYIMMKEKYYFKSRVNESKYAITDEKMMECFSKHIKYILDIAKKENIDLNVVSEKSRKIDREYFPIIKEQEEIYK